MIGPRENDMLRHKATTRAIVDNVKWKAVDYLFDLYVEGREDSDDYKFANGYAYEIQSKQYKVPRKKVADRMTLMGRIAARRDLRIMGVA
jgi:hypothetical protein